MCLLVQKMDFILTEAEELEGPLFQFSDDEIEEDFEDSNFIDDDPVEQESIDFYRDLTNLNHYPKFANQTRDPIEATYSDTESYFREDDQSELYDPENRNLFSLISLRILKRVMRTLKILCSILKIWKITSFML